MKCLLLYADSLAVHGDIIVSEGEMYVWFLDLDFCEEGSAFFFAFCYKTRRRKAGCGRDGGGRNWHVAQVDIHEPLFSGWEKGENAETRIGIAGKYLLRIPPSLLSPPLFSPQQQHS